MVGRVAGTLYLLSAIAAGIPLIYVPASFIVDGDAAATAKNILTSEFVFRACIVSELLGAILLLFAVRTLHRLFIGVDARQASLMVTFALHRGGVSLANVFWGLWLFPFGMLVLKSSALPRFLGIALIANCFALVTVSLTTLLFPAYLDAVSRYAIFARAWRASGDGMAFDERR